MKKRTTCFLLSLTLVLMAMAQTCEVRVALPQRLFGDASTADLSITRIDENGEVELTSMRLSASDGMMKGEWKVQLDQAYNASASWPMDPHVGMAFFLEPGTITIGCETLGRESMLVASGTPLNDTYLAYQHETAPLTSMSERDGVAERYMANYKDTPLFSLLFTNHSALTFSGDKELVERLWQMGGENGKKSKRALDDYNRICHNDVSNGEPLRDVLIADATVEGGTSVRLSDYIGKGKWVFVDFWASWCVGCRQAIPTVKKAYEQLKDKNIMFISIAEWDKRVAALKAMKEEQMPWLQLIDEQGACGSTYMFNTIPRFMLFAPDGTLVEKDVARNNIISLLTEKVEGGN